MALLSATLPLDVSDAHVDRVSASAQRIPELDGLRGVAISMVVVYHAFLFHFAPPAKSLLSYLLLPARIGWSGVDLFFVLSGFLIGGILLDARDSRNYFRTFYIRRFFRIVPIYYATLLLLFVLSAWSRIHPGVHPAWSADNHLPWYLFALFLQNIWMAATSSMGSGLLAAFWSLAVEEQFYLTLPWIIRFFNRQRVLVIAIEAIVLAPVLRIACSAFWPNHPLSWFVLMPCRADALFYGVVGAIALRDALCKAWIASHRVLLRALLVLFALGLPFVTQTNLTANGLLMISVMMSWLAAFYLLVLVYALSFADSFAGSCLRWRWLRWLGSIAYGTYLLHEVVLWSALDFFGGPGPAASFARKCAVSAFAVAATLLVASLSWKYFEKPLVARGHRLVYDPPEGLATRNLVRPN